MRIFMFFINCIYWLWLCIVPTIILGLTGFIMYSNNKANLPYFILLAAIGLVLGVLWAEWVRKKQGLSFFFSRIMASPELDEDGNREEKIKAASKDSL